MNFIEQFNMKTLLARLQHYKGIYEYHITTNTNKDELPDLEQWCSDNDCKLTVIELIKGDTPLQPMLTGIYKDISPQSVLDDQIKIITNLSEHFEVTRLKMEASIQNDNTPKTPEVAKEEPADCYFEHHVKIIIPNDTSIKNIKEGASQHGGHLSRNAKKIDTTQQTRFITQRCNNVENVEAKKQLQTLLVYLKTTRVTITSTVREYNIFDSNIDIDAGWM